MERLTSRKPRVSGMPGVCCTHFEGSDCQAVQGRCADGCPWEEAAWGCLAAYEDTMPLARAQELAQAEKDGRLLILPDVKYTDADGEKALRAAMWTCGYKNNPVTRYTADAIAEKLCREAKGENPPLTLEQLRGMDDADVWVSYPSGLSEDCLIMHALVEVVKENGVVWLTNNLGGRSTFDEVSDDEGLVYRRRPEESME